MLSLCIIMIDFTSVPHGVKDGNKMIQVSRVKTVNRRISRLKHQAHQVGIFDGRIELDSHADTFVAGRNCLLMHYTERVCDVMPYSDEYQPRNNVPIVQVATGYTSMNGRRYILIINEALYMPELDNSLMNPNQLRHYGIIVQDNPYSTEPMVIEKIGDEEEFIACLKSKGTNIYVDTWTPTDRDLNEYKHIVLTSPMEWNPNEVVFPGTDPDVVNEIESRNVNMIESNIRGDDSLIPFDNAYLKPIRIFDIQSFNRRIMKSSVIDTKMALGPLSEDEILPPKIFLSTNRHSNTTAEDLSEIFQISVEQAQMTLDATTQHHVRSAIMPLSRRYRMDRMYEVPRLRCTMATDTMDPRCEGIHRYKYCQVFGSKEMFAAAYPIHKKSDCHVALKKFIVDYGAPEVMIQDGSKEQTGPGTLFQSTLRKNNIESRQTQAHRPNQNPAETVIRELRKKWYRSMFKSNCPKALWTYGLPHFAKLMQVTATKAAGLAGLTPLGYLTGETPDISQYLDFGFYDWVWYKENVGLDVPRLGRFLGTADTVCNVYSFHILPESGIPIIAGTVQRVTQLELETDANKQRIKSFNEKIAQRFKDDYLQHDSDRPSFEDYGDVFEDDEDFVSEFHKVFNNPDVKEADEDFDKDLFDNYINMEVSINRGKEHPELARVTKRLKDHRGNYIGTANDNPILDTRMYEVEFHDGTKQALAANVIAENIFASVDEEGHRHILLDSIVDVRKSRTAVSKEDGFVVSSNGVKRRIETTKGWDVLIQWKDGSTTWNKLKDVKDSYPVELAEYAVNNKVDDEPAFAWWVPYTIKKKARIISKIKSKYWQRTHKYGIRIPKSIKDAIRIDAENGNTLWWDAIMMEMRNVRPAFEVYDGDIKDLIGYQEIKCHAIFDVKLGENFRRKARLVAGGHTTNVPASICYSSVVSRESVRLSLLVAALNDVEILSCDIQNAYLTAPCKEKIYCRAGSEFGSEAGKIMIVKMALYGLKSSSAAFRSKLAGVICDLGYRPSKADPDVYLKPAVKPDGFRYYAMILVYSDDILSISHEPSKAIEGIKSTFKLKGDKATVPEMYLGGSISEVENANGRKCWTMSSEKYVKSAVANIEEKLAKSGQRLPSKCSTPFQSGYHPSEDVTPELNGDGLTFFQEQIGVLRWAIELGRVDILLEVSLLSSHLALPRVGHLQQVYHIFGYLKTSPRRRLYFDPDHPIISEKRFQSFDWEDFYADAKEPIPYDMPEPLGNNAEIHAFVDASHASDKTNRRSQTGILIFVNRAPIIFYSKKQNSVETSTFGSEFTAMKQAVELIKGLRYKLRMFGIPIEGPANIYCDNEAVYRNVAIPESVLSKKMHGISYHFCREAVAAGIVRVAKENTLTNLADLFTKVMGRVKRDELLGRFMY